jgi:hypothetical protein
LLNILDKIRVTFLHYVPKKNKKKSATMAVIKAGEKN